MRSTDVVGFSVPPEINEKFEELRQKKHMNKSEFFREVLDVYFKSVESTTAPSPSPLGLGESDLAQILKSYWDLKSSKKLKTIIIGLGIIVKGNKVLIGSRKKDDRWVDNLSWVFPGGKMQSLNFEKEVEREIKEETGLTVEIKDLIAARIHPDSGFKKVQIVALFFYCEPITGEKPTPGGDLSQLKWVNPTEVFRYFTTSTCDEVTRFLMSVGKSN